MIKRVSDIYELNKLLRTEILAQTNLPNDHVLNALSVHGSNLEKRLQDQIFVPFSIADSFIIFSLEPRTSSSNNTQTIVEGLLSTSSYSFKLVIYGQSSMLAAQIIKARFESEAVRQKLFDEGVYIEKISDPQPFNEFINSTMWLRSDVDIDISCETLIEQVSTLQEFDNVGELIINDKEMLPPIPEDKGRVLGTVIDCTTGNAIQGITVQVLDSYQQEVLFTTTTNENGEYSTKALDFGYYYLYFRDERDLDVKYADQEDFINLRENELQQKQFLSPHSIEEPWPDLRIVLWWNEFPPDLELYVKDSFGDIVYSGSRSSDNNNVVMDFSSIDEAGPKTITISNLKEDREYFVYATSLSEETTIDASNAAIDIYRFNRVFTEMTVPQSPADSNWWNILTCSYGSIEIIDELTNQEPGPTEGLV